MRTVKDLIRDLQQLVKGNPKVADFPYIYAIDDEGNEYYRIGNEPCLLQVEDLEDYNLEIVGFYDGEEGDLSVTLEDCNCVIIN